MRRVLKDTGSIYLHCDPTASNYLRLILDAIFGFKNFRNEVIWCYAGGGVPKMDFPRKHDVILRYAGKNRTFNVERKPYGKHASSGRRATDLGGTRSIEYNPKGTPINDWWNDVNPLINWHKERLGYPTQKPLALLERIIKTSSNEGDLVLDPFCGCGTTIHAAETLNRKWIGIDISTFSVGLMKERILNNFPLLKSKDIETHGTPYNLTTARKLAKKDPFEFEKWVCGAIGAQGMFHNPGDRGGDGGVDGVINFALFRGLEEKAKKQHAIVQVKAGKVSPNSVRALSHTLEQFDATAGIFVCFDEYMNTVENNRKKGTFSDLTGTYPVIQGFSVENLLNDQKPLLPPLVFRKNAKLQGDLFQKAARATPDERQFGR